MVADDGEYASLLGLDDDLEPHGADHPLLDPGSDGLVTQSGPRLLQEMARRREAGASLAELRRSAGQIDPFRVTDRTLAAAVDQGQRLNDWEASGRIRERSRRFHGIAVTICATCGRQVLTRALRPGGCAVCQG